MDISLTLAFTIIICTTVSCFTVIMWQIMKHLINQNTIQQATQSSNINLDKQHNLNKTNQNRKIKSFMRPRPVWIYKETTTTTNNPADTDNESVKNESADNKSVKNESVDNKSVKNESVDNESADNKSAKK